MFTYAHVKWFYGQSERAYYLNYFIISCGSPYIFTKVVGFLVKFWRSCGRLNVLDAEIGGPAVYKSGINISIWATAHLPLP